MIGVLSLLLNLIIAGLLMATISYCWVLNKRIKILQDSKGELANLLNYFDESTTKASESIIALQTASKKIGENIQNRIDKANYLMDDLAFMIEKGEKVAAQLENNFSVSRARSRAVGGEDAVATHEVDDAIITPKQVKTPSKPPLRNVPVIEKKEENNSSPQPKEKQGVSLEAVLERVIGRVRQNSPQKPAASAGGDSSGRSRAEQELLDMIRAGMKG